jgi:acetylornithine deacetylase/succinyl-diaminopimelate desuccinylase-like protein
VSAYAEQAVLHLKSLIRIDTGNPPGNETKAAQYCADTLAQAGLDPVMLECVPGRGNTVCRLRGDGSASPLLLHAHLDTVRANPDGWTHPPFAAEEADGFIWGRGAVDMKHMVAMILAVMTQLKSAGFAGRRDIIACLTANEEEDGVNGAGWLVDNHADLIRTDFGLGEVGGMSVTVGGHRIYPVMTAEKGRMHFTASAKGEGGHGSMPVGDNAISKVGLAAYRLKNVRGTPHITRAARAMIKTAGRARGGLRGAFIDLLFMPPLTGFIIDRFTESEETARQLISMLYNTVTPTIWNAGGKFNVIPTGASMVLDGRMIPGVTVEEFTAEVRRLLGPTVEVEAGTASPALEAPLDTPLYRAIEQTVQKHDPGAVVSPYLMAGCTDWKAFSRLGMNMYGFTPVKFPADLEFSTLFHNVDERIPAQGFIDGVEMLKDLVTLYCG